MGVLAAARRRVRSRIALLIAKRADELVRGGMPYPRAVEQAMIDFVDGRLTR